MGLILQGAQLNCMPQGQLSVPFNRAGGNDSIKQQLLLTLNLQTKPFQPSPPHLAMSDSKAAAIKNLFKD